MAKIILDTMDSHYETRPGRDYTIEVSTFDIGAGDPFPRESVEVRTLADIRAAVAAYGARAAEAAPARSFRVHIAFAKGQRKIAGFDATSQSGDFLGRKAWMRRKEG